MNPVPRNQVGADGVPHHVRLPANRFYWAIVDAGVLPRKLVRSRRMLRQQLGYLFEAKMPLPVDHVQCAFHKLDGARYLACGMERKQLRASIEERPGILSLSPAEAPEHIGASESDLEQLNLLYGAFEPQAVSSMRRQWVLSIAAAVLLTALVISGGLWRRATWFDRSSQMLETACADVYGRVFGVDARSGTQPPELRLLSELRQLRQTRRAPREHVQLTDVSLTLSEFLKQWPQQEAIHARTESVSVAPTVVTVRAHVTESGQGQELADALGRTSGWQLSQPQVTTGRDGVRTVIQLRREEEANP